MASPGSIPLRLQADCYLDLNPGALDTIAGRVLQIGTDTMLKTAWAGDGNDTIIANNAGDMIQGGRGNDTIVAGAGADALLWRARQRCVRLEDDGFDYRQDRVISPRAKIQLTCSRSGPHSDITEPIPSPTIGFRSPQTVVAAPM